ncbi:hypothetical protein HZ326_23063 [Fusarium oxysporum f. sp. albedinis]|nr:hypothetical protein HZ326_23063 [Fusarium oxysporum f. sp. albedinis]
MTDSTSSRGRQIPAKLKEINHRLVYSGRLSSHLLLQFGCYSQGPSQSVTFCLLGIDSNLESSMAIIWKYSALFLNPHRRVVRNT